MCPVWTGVLGALRAAFLSHLAEPALLPVVRVHLGIAPGTLVAATEARQCRLPGRATVFFSFSRGGLNRVPRAMLSRCLAGALLLAGSALWEPADAQYGGFGFPSFGNPWFGQPAPPRWAPRQRDLPRYRQPRERGSREREPTTPPSPHITSTTRPAGWNPSKTPSDQKCYPCLRYKP